MRYGEADRKYVLNVLKHNASQVLLQLAVELVIDVTDIRSHSSTGSMATKWLQHDEMAQLCLIYITKECIRVVIHLVFHLAWSKSISRQALRVITLVVVLIFSYSEHHKVD